jgi:hypothetical protein
MVRMVTFPPRVALSDAAETSDGPEEMRDFPLDASEHDLEDLRSRLRSARRPEAETVDDWSQGVPLKTRPYRPRTNGKAERFIGPC